MLLSINLVNAVENYSNNSPNRYNRRGSTPDENERTSLRMSTTSSISPPPPIPPKRLTSYPTNESLLTSDDDIYNNILYWDDEAQKSLSSSSSSYSNNDDETNTSLEFNRPIHNDINNNNNNNNYQQPKRQRQPPPPPFPSISPQANRFSRDLDLKKGLSTTLPSIHYSFPQHSSSLVNTETYDKHTIQSAVTSSPYPDINPNINLPKFASARQDVITKYIMASYWHRCYITLSSALLGCFITSFLGQSLLGHIPSYSILIGISILFSILTWIRNNIYGELIRAISLTMIFSVQRSIQIRNQYPAYQYLYNAILGDTSNRRRKPFPPTNNPWTWSSENNNNDDDDDNNNNDNDVVEFQMIPTVIAMAFIGSVMGTNVPLLPSSLGALLGATIMAYTTTLSSSRGDLCRCMGMRIVAFVREFIIIANTDLHLPKKSAIVASAILDKLLILDRQHSIRQRLGSAISALIDTVSRIQRDMQQQPSSTSSNKNTFRTDNVNLRSRRTYDDDIDRVRDVDNTRPSSYNESQPKTYGDNRRNVYQRSPAAERPPETTKPDKKASSGWFSFFPSKPSASKNKIRLKSDGLTDEDSEEPFPYDNGWKDDRK